MDTINAPGIATMGASFASIAGTISSIPTKRKDIKSIGECYRQSLGGNILDGEIFRSEQFISMEGRDRLLRGSDQILVVLGISVYDFVQFLVKLLELSSFGHVILEHELGRLQGGIASRR